MLLSDPKISALLRQDLIPCWESVQDTAKVTIQFGDGKTLERTIGGNTVIYLCRPDGGVVDVFPGVYTPEDFLSEARPALALIKGGASATTIDKLASLHRQQLMMGRAHSMQSVHAVVISKSGVESPIRDRLLPRKIEQKREQRQASKAAHGAAPPLHDVSKDPTNARQVRRSYLNDAERDQLSPEALGHRLVVIDSSRNRLYVRPRVHQMMAAHPRMMTPSEWKLPMFEGLLGTDLSKPYHGLVDAIVPGTSDIVQ